MFVLNATLYVGNVWSYIWIGRYPANPYLIRGICVLIITNRLAAYLNDKTSPSGQNLYRRTFRSSERAMSCQLNRDANFVRGAHNLHNDQTVSFLISISINA